MGPRDEYKSSYRDSTTGLRWALAAVSLIAVAAVITAVTLWLKPRHVEQAPPKEQAPTGVPRADLEQITGQLLLQNFPGHLFGSPAPVIFLPRLVHPRIACSGASARSSA